MPVELQPLAEMIIGNIDDYGYLKIPLEELSVSLNAPVEKIQEALQAIQAFDPPGVGARDLRECLMLQLERFQADGEPRIPHHPRFHGRARQTAHTRNRQGHRLRSGRDSGRAGKHRQAGTPSRARVFAGQRSIRFARCFVTRTVDGFNVTTNNEHIPHLRISNTYKDLMSQGENSSEVRNYIREKIRAGKFLIKSLHQRQATILNIAKEIVKRQHDFMDKGRGVSQAAHDGDGGRGGGRA